MDLKPKSVTSYREIAIGGSVALLLFLNITPLNQSFRSVFSFIFSPLHYAAGALGASVDETIDSISQVGSLKEQNNILKLEIAQKEAENQNLFVLLEENAALKKELDLGTSEDSVVEARVLGFGVGGVDDYLIINKGSKDGIKDGDVVRIGNIFIGLISNVERNSSRVLLPNSSNSFIQVFIAEGSSSSLNIDQLNERYDNDASLSKIESGIAAGSSSGIVVENIATDADVKEGDAVIINDTKVNTFLYLGQVSEVIDDPAASQKKAFVTIPLNYQQINFVFVSIEND